MDFFSELHPIMFKVWGEGIVGLNLQFPGAVHNAALVDMSVRPSVLRFHTISGVFLTDFLQTWYKISYWKGVCWDCRWVNYVK